MNATKSLENVTALAFESRMADSTASLLQRHGATTISAPSMQEVPLEDHQDVFSFAEKLFAGDVDILICTTGVGTDMMIKTLKTRYALQKILQALSTVTVVARGPKPTKVLRKFEVPITVSVPEPNTWKEILEAMEQHEETSDLKGKLVAIQEYGESNEELNSSLRDRGATVLQVPIYRWSLPDDLEPLKNGIQAIINGKVQIVLFTSKTQIDHALKAATRESLDEKFKEALNETWVASIGPVCTKGLKSHGIEVDFEPSRPKLGVFINEVAENAPEEIH